MKIIHCADLHLDSKMETNLTPQQAIERRYEILESFEGMIQYARNHKIKVILIAGDMFDSVQAVQRSIKKRAMDAIENAGDIDFLYLQGNHDYGQYAPSIESYPENLKTFNTSWTYYDYGNVTIGGVEFGNQNDNRLYSELELDSERINVITMHGQVMAGELNGQPGFINLEWLKDRGVDYLALGHLHSYQKASLDNRGLWCYSGCLEGRGYDEIGEKGFVVADLSRGGVKTTFIPTSKRVIHHIEVDVTDLPEREILLKAVHGVEDIPNEDYVKLTLVGDIGEDVEIDIIYLERKLRERFYTCKVSDETQIVIDYQKYMHDISLKGEFVRTVQMLNMPDEDKKKIIFTGLKALRGKGDR